jgi:hypothetical protein
MNPIFRHGLWNKTQAILDGDETKTYCSEGYNNNIQGASGIAYFSSTSSNGCKFESFENAWESVNTRQKKRGIKSFDQMPTFHILSFETL